MKNKNQQNQPGFTLIELIIVMAIIVIVFGISFSALMQSQATQLFLTNFGKVYSLVNNARSLAISGKGQLDYTDFDNDGQWATSIPPDYVTPANYGVYFDTTPGKTNVTLFADMNPPKSGSMGAKGRYDHGTSYALGMDLDIDSLNLPSTNKLQIVDGAGNSPINSAIFYSPNYADISYQALDTSSSPFIYIKLTQTATGQCRQIAIHRLAGIPESGPCT